MQVLLKSEVTRLVPERVDAPISEGVLTHGCFLEGASWTWRLRDGQLADPVPKVGSPVAMHAPLSTLVVVHASGLTHRCAGLATQVAFHTMPPIALSARLVEPGKEGPARGSENLAYACPVYLNPKRRSTDFVTELQLPCAAPSSKYTLGGVAMFLSI